MPKFGFRYPQATQPVQVRENPAKQVGRWLFKKLPLVNLLGGAILFLIPNTVIAPREAAPAPVAVTAPASPEVSASRPVDYPIPTADIEDGLRDILRAAVWLALILYGAGSFTSKASITAAGGKNGQASMVLGGLMGVAASTLMMASPADETFRILNLLASSVLINGYGRMMRDKAKVQKGESPYTTNFKPLYSREALREQMRTRTENPDFNPAPHQEMAGWTRQLLQVVQDVAKDEASMMKMVGTGAFKGVKDPAAVARKIRENARQVEQCLRGQRKEQPDFMQAVLEQNVVGSFIMLVGVAAWFAFHTVSPEAAQLSQAVIAAGSGLADLSLAGVGLRLKGRKKLLATAPLLATLGIAKVDGNPGVGLSMIGAGLMDQYFVDEALEEKPPGPKAPEGKPGGAPPQP